MFARPNARHHQVAYVTNDLDAAMELFKREYEAPGFFAFSNVDTGPHKPGDPQLRIALTRVGDVEVELIEPLGDTAAMYKDFLPGGDELSIRFHHVAVRVEGAMDNWDKYAASIDTDRHPIVFEGQMGDDLRFFYTDERAMLGHYVEHMWMSPAMLDQLETAVPRSPTQG